LEDCFPKGDKPAVGTHALKIMKIVPLEKIKQILPSVDLIAEIEKGFVAY
jgi:hypothetical protein